MLAAALVWAGGAFAQGPDGPGTTPGAAEPEAGETVSGALVQTGPEAETFQLGEPIPIEVSIVHPPEVDVVLPDTFGTGRWELLSSDARTVESEKEWTTTLDLRFAVYRPGETTLEPFPIDLVGTRGTGRLLSEPVTVKVLSALEEVEGEADFAAPSPATQVWVEDHSIAVATGFAAVSLLFGLFFFWYRRRSRDWEPAPPPRPPHEVALERLGQLAADDLVERGEHMLFYVRLSETIREYLGRRYGFKGIEMTTTEILASLDEADVTWPDSLSREDVADFLLHCDAVKFGGYVPTPSMAAERLRRGFSIVESTRPAAPQSVEAVAGAATPPAPESDARTESDEDTRWQPPAPTESTSEVPNEASTEAPTESPSEAPTEVPAQIPTDEPAPDTSDESDNEQQADGPGPLENEEEPDAD